MERVRQLGADDLFRTCFGAVVTRTHRLFDARDPDSHENLNPEDAAGSAKYYYQVRNNLSHRGKGAWRDGEIVRRALLELLATFKCLLQKSWPAPQTG